MPYVIQETNSKNPNEKRYFNMISGWEDNLDNATFCSQADMGKFPYLPTAPDGYEVSWTWKNKYFIYLVENPKYHLDSFISMVISATDEISAKLVHPSGKYHWYPEKKAWVQYYRDENNRERIYYLDHLDWADPKYLTVKTLGESYSYSEKILATSFYHA